MQAAPLFDLEVDEMLPVVIFEGVDKSGKSTLVAEFNKATNFRYLVLDRFLVSSLVYDEAFGRDRREYYSELCREFGKLENVAFLVVHCTCLDKKVVQSRLERAGEELPEQLSDINAIDCKFTKEICEQQSIEGFARMGGRNERGLVRDFIVVDTGTYTVQKCVNMIKAFVENFDWESGLQ